MDALTDYLLQPQHLSIATNLFSALIAGGLIGLERSFHGRPAGFRTHTLVCTASSLLMLVTMHQWDWMPGASAETVRTDPMRVAQGIMTGIGFLGAGVIYKEGFSVRGLTTAASIWVTSAIGILMGIGFFFPAILATILTLLVLTVFRYIESWMPSQAYAHFRVRFDRDQAMAEDELRALLASHGFVVENLSHRVVENGLYFEYDATVRSAHARHTSPLAENLRKHPLVRELSISPSGD